MIGISLETLGGDVVVASLVLLCIVWPCEPCASWIGSGMGFNRLGLQNSVGLETLHDFSMARYGARTEAEPRQQNQNPHSSILTLL